jgi:hypothetical protein
VTYIANDLLDHKLGTKEQFSKLDTAITNLESSLNIKQQTVPTDLFQQLADQQKYTTSLKKELLEQETRITLLINQLDSRTIQIDKLIKKSKDRKQKYAEDMHLMQSNIEALAAIVERLVNHTQHKQ